MRCPCEKTTPEGGKDYSLSSASYGPDKRRDRGPLFCAFFDICPVNLNFDHLNAYYCRAYSASHFKSGAEEEGAIEVLRALTVGLGDRLSAHLFGHYSSDWARI